jgi:uncharacterized protein
MKENRQYQFSWDLLGDSQLGRPNLGKETRLEVYRLMKFCLRDVVEQHCGTEEADRIIYEAGKLAGKHLYEHLIKGAQDITEFVKIAQQVLKDLQMGIFRVEQADVEKGLFVVTLSEDLDCSGLPEMDTEICTYDEGFLSALFECFLGRPFQGKEIDCWCSGDRTCRFEIQSTD